MPHNLRNLLANPDRRLSMSSPPEVGSPAPDFTLPSHQDSDIQLSSLRGTKVAVLFFPFDFSPG
jgi:peroxiredoxin